MKAINRKFKFAADVCMDAGFVAAAAVLTLGVTERGVFSSGVLQDLTIYLTYSLPLLIGANMAVRIYRQMWQFVSISGLMRIFIAVFTSLTACIIIGNFTSNLFSFSFYFLNLFLVAFLMWGYRVRVTIARKFLSYMTRIESYTKREPVQSKKKVLLVGAGSAAAILLQNYEDNRRDASFCIIGMVDDDKSKTAKILHGVKVLGECNHIPEIFKQYRMDDIIIAIPSASSSQMNQILKYCKNTNCRIRIMPFIDQMSAGKLEDLLSTTVNDLIGRQEYQIDYEAVQKMIAGKRVLVTGGGGSIGSELCRQIMRFGPEKLILVDIYENSTYDLYKELMDTYGSLGQAVIEVRICSILNEREIELLFKRFRPELVFHAAAYKHVPLMEICPKEAVKNNIFGTYLLASLAAKYAAAKFLLVSTDKAVNPTNVMGATKRATELIVKAMQGEHPATEFVAVRFGNVLGSNGSVVIQFKRQINSGGPVTVTHPDIIRYFMTISEAVSLVLEAMSFAKGGELYVLDMGSPVKIDSLARKMIEFAGLRPDVDIQIAYTGLRPGEKLYEELLIEEEGILRTDNEKIFVTHPKDVGMEFVQNMMRRLGECIQQEGNIKDSLKLFIDTFRDAHTEKARQAEQDYPQEGIM